MGTPSLTRIFAGKEQICSLYSQWDGYLTGQGRALANFLTDFEVLNGIPLAVPERFANGPYCLAAQLVAHFKAEPGGFYLYPPSAEPEYYTYDVVCDDDGVITITYFCYDEQKFTGSPEAFSQFINQQEKE